MEGKVAFPLADCKRENLPTRRDAADSNKTKDLPGGPSRISKFSPSARARLIE
jgi:hypothetical protein